MIIILHNIRSLHNVGSIFRTADAAGIKKIYLTGITSTPYDRLGRPRAQLTKVSLGAEKTVEWEYVKSSSTLLKKLKCEKYKILAIEQHQQSIFYYNLKAKSYKLDKVALVLGNEIKGLSSSILKRCDNILEIPMAGKKESLNVAVAFGIVAFGLIWRNK
ncbi:MAG: TrmH family RNA methyltransferase [bacterium]|nr:TrmH family RNA methyltransferase [bacterium]